MRKNQTTIKFTATFKENKKDSMEVYYKWAQLRAIMELCNTQTYSIEVTNPNNNHSVIEINFDRHFPHILKRLAKYIRTLEEFVIYLNGTWAIYEEEEKPEED